jgi:hypothetical protein
MNANVGSFRGVVHGKTIELDQEPGLPDGQHVTVRVKPVASNEQYTPGDGIRRSAGSWADDPKGVDEFLEWNRQQRKIGRPEIDS